MPVMTVIRKSQPHVTKRGNWTDYLFVMLFFLSYSSWDLVPRMFVLELDSVSHISQVTHLTLSFWSRHVHTNIILPCTYILVL